MYTADVSTCQKLWQETRFNNRLTLTRFQDLTVWSLGPTYVVRCFCAFTLKSNQLKKNYGETGRKLLCDKKYPSIGRCLLFILTVTVDVKVFDSVF